MVGKNVNNYGQYFNNDLVKLLTNFAYTTSPSNPQIGQLWFDTINNRLNVYDGLSFNPTYGATVSGTAAITTSTGDLWYDTVNSQLKVWNGSTFKLIGPAVSSTLGKFGIELPPGGHTSIREDSTNIPQNVGLLYSYGNTVGLITQSSFSMSIADSETYLNTSTISTIVEGITITNDLDVKGDFYIDGIKQFPVGQTLTAYYDITPYGDPNVAENIEAANIAIGDFLPLMFSTVTNVTYGDIAYPLNSDAKVVCSFGYIDTTISVRRFRLIDDPLHPGIRIWKWYDVYYNDTLNTLTNIVTL